MEESLTMNVPQRPRPVRRKKRSRGVYLLSMLFLAAVLGASYETYEFLKHEIVQDESFPVRAVNIDGALVHVSKKEIADLVGVMAGERNLATLDVGKIHNALLHLPWVDKVSIVKKMPDTLYVAVVEHTPAAFWNDKGLYDAKSRSVFYPNLTDFDQSLVRLVGAHDELAPEVYDYAVQFLAILRKANLQMVQVELDSIRAYRILLENGVTLVLGRDDDSHVILSRLKRFVDVQLKERFNFNDISYVDLRYDAGFAVGYKDGSQEAKAKSGQR